LCDHIPDGELSLEPAAASSDGQVTPNGSTKRCHCKWEPELQAGWSYYLKRCKRSSHYEFTGKRRSLGLRGLRACADFAAKHGAAAEPGDALRLFKLAVDRLAESKYHNGENDTGQKFLDWETLFSSRTLPAPQKLTDFWLNDEKFPASKRGAA
jgi:hypothetical protein